MIELKQVCAGYEGKEVLHNIDLKFEAGKVTVLVGPNGCGKSTLLKAIVRLNLHTSGEIMVQEKAIEIYSAKELAKQVAYLPQSRNVPDISVLRMVLHGRFPYLNYPRKYREIDFQKAREALRWVGLEDKAEENVNRLSGGNQQKVYIAMALAQDTPVILMDEPTTYLDISHQLQVMKLVRRLANEGKAVIMVLHDLTLAMQYADGVCVMSEGNLVSRGTPEEVFQSGVLEEVFGVKVERIEGKDGFNYFYES